jgi:ribonuclease BN (tRNA processing enzyme)
MYNVGFGDCFLLHGERENLLVDFGSDTPNLLSEVATSITEECREKELSILITHFHNDHINGFLDQDLNNNVIKKIYLPDILQMKRCGGKINFYQLHILSDIFSAIKLKNKLDITLYSLLKRLTKVREHYCHAKKHTFYQIEWNK